MEIKQYIESNPQATTSDERLFSLLSHLSFFFGGLFVSLIIYFTQKDKSKFVAFNSLEAIFFQLSYLIIVLPCSFLFGICLGIIDAAKGSAGRDLSGIMIIIFWVLLFIVFAALMFFGIYSVFVAIKAYKGEIKKYPIIGNIAYRKVYGR